MKSLIKKILKESEFDWTSNIQPHQYGKFDDSDVSYDDKDAKIYLGDEGIVTYNLTINEVLEYTYESNDDWVLESLIASNGTYSDDYDTAELDYDEVDYMGHYLTDEQKRRLHIILRYYADKTGTEILNIDSIMDDGLGELEKPLLDLYRGRWDWDDFTTESLSFLGQVITNNRWLETNRYYLNTLIENNVEIQYYIYNDVTIKMPFPYKGSNNLSDILLKTGLNEVSWIDVYYGEWDSSGGEEEIRKYFNYMLFAIEEQIREETNS